jgi:NADH:ubiquinone oxidoreductase subunit F (NADH-binding)
LNSLFRRPGLYEIELGTPLSHVLFDLAGGLATGELAGVLIGGPLAGVVPPSLFDVPVTFEDLHAIGGALGHGGVVAFDTHTSVVELAHQVFRFGAYESCGKCTPCRVGSTRAEMMLAVTAAAGPLDASEREEFARVVEALGTASLCGHGTGLAEFARSLARHYPGMVQSCFG